MNQNIVEGPQDFPWHSERKADIGAGRQLLTEFKKNPAGGDVSGERRHLSMAGRKYNWQRQGKAHRATNFLPAWNLTWLSRRNG